MLRKPLSLTITPHCYGKNAWKASKNTDRKKEILSHEPHCDSLSEAWIVNSKTGGEQSYTEHGTCGIMEFKFICALQVCCKNSYIFLPQELSSLLLN